MALFKQNSLIVLKKTLNTKKDICVIFIKKPRSASHQYVACLFFVFEIEHKIQDIYCGYTQFYFVP